MIVDWIVYGLIIWGLTRLLFFVNLLALFAAKFIRYQVISEDIGTTITPSNPLGMSGAFVFACLFSHF